MNVHCHRHPLSVVPCPQCRAEDQPIPPPFDDPDYAAMKAELEARRTPKATQKRLADFAAANTEGSKP